MAADVFLISLDDRWRYSRYPLTLDLVSFPTFLLFKYLLIISRSFLYSFEF